ncbi:hypothetical protein ACVW0J_005874 [Bradyrhizobium sp. i1.7.7]
MREEIVLLKHHPDLAAQRQLVEPGIGHLDAFDLNAAGRDRLQRIDAADQRGFA